MLTRSVMLQGVDLVFYGDSILKLFKDGKPKTSGRSNVFIDYFGNYSAAVAGASSNRC